MKSSGDNYLDSRRERGQGYSRLRKIDSSVLISLVSFVTLNV